VRSRSSRKGLVALERILLSLFISYTELLSRDGKRSESATVEGLPAAIERKFWKDNISTR